MKLREEVQAMLNRDEQGRLKDLIDDGHTLNKAQGIVNAERFDTRNGAKMASKFYEPLLTKKDTRIRELEAELKRRTELLKEAAVRIYYEENGTRRRRDLSKEEHEKNIVTSFFKIKDIPLDE